MVVYREHSFPVHSFMCWLLLCFLLLFSSVFALETSSQLRKAGEDRLKYLLTASAKQSLIRLTPSSFKTHVAQSPRPYSLLVIFTALGASYKCEVCQQLHAEVGPLAEWYETKRFKDGQLQHKGFFAIVDFEANQDVFRQLNLQSAPVVIFVPSTESGNGTLVSKVLVETAAQNNYNIQKWGLTADGLQKFFVSRSSIGYDLVPAYQPPPDYTNLAILAFFAITLIVSIRILHSNFPMLFNNPMVYFALSCAFFLFCASGGMYNIIRGMPFMHSDKGLPVYFHPDQSQQFGMESVMIGFLYFSTAIVVILLTQGSVITDSDGKPRLFVMLALVFLFQLIFSWTRALYTRKNGGYNYGYVVR